MNLINTTGLALIGPGSEWFWSMAQFVVVTATLVAIYRQLKAQGAANALGKLQFFEDRWTTDRMSYARLTSALGLKTAKPVAGMDPAMVEIADFWEDLAGLLEDRHVKVADVEALGRSCQMWWAFMEPAIQAERRVQESPVYDSWEGLARVMHAHDIETGRPMRLDDATLPKLLDNSIRINAGRLQMSQDLAAGRMPAIPT